MLSRPGDRPAFDTHGDGVIVIAVIDNFGKAAAVTRPGKTEGGMRKDHRRNNDVPVWDSEPPRGFEPRTYAHGWGPDPLSRGLGPHLSLIGQNSSRGLAVVACKRP